MLSRWGKKREKRKKGRKHPLEGESCEKERKSEDIPTRPRSTAYNSLKRLLAGASSETIKEEKKARVFDER